MNNSETVTYNFTKGEGKSHLHKPIAKYVSYLERDSYSHCYPQCLSLIILKYIFLQSLSELGLCFN